MSKIALVHCPHAIGWCYYGPPSEGMENHFMRLLCPCNDKSTLLAEYDVLDLIRAILPDGSVERGMQVE